MVKYSFVQKVLSFNKFKCKILKPPGLLKNWLMLFLLIADKHSVNIVKFIRLIYCMWIKYLPFYHFTLKLQQKRNYTQMFKSK